MVPRTRKTLAFSAAVSRSAGALITSSCYHRLSLPKLRKSCSFIVRAESNAEVEVEDSEEVEVTQIVASEEKSPRKPRIKLGDIMGVIHWIHILFKLLWVQCMSITCKIYFIRICKCDAKRSEGKFEMFSQHARMVIAATQNM